MAVMRIRIFLNDCPFCTILKVIFKRNLFKNKPFKMQYHGNNTSGLRR